MKIDNDFLDEIYKECVRERDASDEGSKDHRYFSGITHFIETLQTYDKDLEQSNSPSSLKDYALDIIHDLEKNEGYDLSDGCFILQWRYDERPDVLVTLTLGDFEIFNLQDDGDLH